ncbi:THAP domain-containing protein 6-like [Aulostomus maculatus]
MPSWCAAWGCGSRHTNQSKSQGITFHRFPKKKELRRQWEVALRRKGFSASKCSVLCSQHFKLEDFDMTGQTVRLREGVKPSVFNFPAHLQKPVKTRTTKTSRKAAESLLLNPGVPLRFQEPKHLLLHADHSYALPGSPSDLKARLSQAIARVASLERELRNVKDRERRAKSMVSGLLKDLKGKNLINEELKKKLDLYSDLPVQLLSKHGSDYTKDQRQFAHTLYRQGPKAYNYLRESLHLHLPHPHTLQRWTSSVGGESDLDILTGRQDEDPAIINVGL